MIYSNNKVYLLFFFVLISCFSQEDNRDDKALKNLIDVISKQNFSFKGLNFHCEIETLNNNIFVVDIVASKSLPSSKDLVVNYFQNDSIKVFVYDRKSTKSINNKLKKKNLISDKTNSPFLVPDTKFWRVLVTKEKELVRYEKLTPINYWGKDENNINEDW